jgi:tetratricopeptide (TPR) repeat protein
MSTDAPTLPAPRPPLVALTVAGALLLSLLAYLPAIVGSQLLRFDDPFFFQAPANSVFQAGLGAVIDPSQPIANAWLPVAHLSLYFDYVCTGSAPLWPHLHALLLHALAGAALVRLLLALGLRARDAHLAGALFLLHPALAESVAWVSGRKDVLSGLFVFLALQIAVAGARTGRRRHLLLLALLTALAMYSKPTAVVLPLLVAAVVAFVGGAKARWALPAVSLLVTLPIAWHHQTIAAAEGTLAAGSIGDRLLQVPGAFAHYLGTALWPLHLNVLYPEVQTLERFAGAVAGALLLSAAFVGAAAVAWWRPSWRPVGLGLGAFALAFLPFNTAFPASSIAAADRYLYLMVPGLCLAMVALLARLHARGPWFAAVLLLPLLWLTGARAHDFRDDQSLWRASLAQDDDNAVAHLNLVDALIGEALVRGDFGDAAMQSHLESAAKAARYPIHELRARELAPDAPTVVAFASMRELAAIVDELQAAAANGGASRLPADDPRGLAADRALATALAATRAAPKHPRQAAEVSALLLAQAQWDRARDRVLEALRHFRQSRQHDPTCFQAWRGEVALLRERNLHEEAVGIAQQALALRPDPALRQDLALSLAALGRIDDAEIQLRAFLRDRPDDRDTGRVLANVLSVRAYQKLSDGPAARTAVQRLVADALHYFPEEPRAQLVLGRLAREDGDLGAAAEHFRLAMQRLPDLEEPRLQYANVLAAIGYEQWLRQNQDAAADAWRLCVQHAPADFDFGEIKNHLRRIAETWRQRAEAAKAKDDLAAMRKALRRSLQVCPEQPDTVWQLAVYSSDDPATDLAELEQWCRTALAWQRERQRDSGPQTLLLALTLARAGKVAEAKALAQAYVAAPPADAKPQILAELRLLLDG